MRKLQFLKTMTVVLLVSSLLFVSVAATIAMQSLIHFLADYLANIRVPIPYMGYSKLF